MPERSLTSPGAFFESSASAAQLAANRENAQKSTGPTSEEGKARIRFNAVATGLTGRTVCLRTDDAALYKPSSSPTKNSSNPSAPKKPASSNPLPISAGVSTAFPAYTWLSYFLGLCAQSFLSHNS
jgi:hypothetical protein